MEPGADRGHPAPRVARRPTPATVHGEPVPGAVHPRHGAGPQPSYRSSPATTAAAGGQQAPAWAAAADAFDRAAAGPRRRPGRGRPFRGRPHHGRVEPDRDCHPGGTQQPKRHPRARRREPHAAGLCASLVEVFTAMPPGLARSLTWDQGKEMSCHLELSSATGMAVYFCRRSSPRQRGSNENMNGLLRQYFPKGSDLSVPGTSTSRSSPPSSTPDHARPSAGGHRPTSWPPCWTDRGHPPAAHP